MLGLAGQYPLRGNCQRPQGGSLQRSAESRALPPIRFAMAAGDSRELPWRVQRLRVSSAAHKLCLRRGLRLRGEMD
jgi:hypothetical protein